MLGKDFSAPAYPSSGYSPVGVVVVPGTHNVYGDGSCGVMSIKPMNYNTPDTGGTSEQGMCWGVQNTDIETLSNLNYVPYVGKGSSVGDASSTVVGQASSAYLPSDKFSAVQCPHDTDAYYYSSSSSYYQGPSPYLTDGSRNPAYYQTSSPSSTANALADFDGVGNTKILTDLATAEDWKTASSITNSSSSGYYPSACCCWRYHTDGTSQGDWYLPACGELGYIMPKFNQTQASIKSLISAYGDSFGVQLGSSSQYWSSSEYISGTARPVFTGDGLVRYGDKNGYRYVRAWLRVGRSVPSLLRSNSLKIV